MAKINPKAVGSDFERTVCKVLSKWISGGTRTDLFWRSAMSGGRGTESQSGDVSAVDPLGAPFIKLFVVECKTRKVSCMLDHLFRVSSNEIDVWWKKLCAEASKFNKLPMLVLKEHRRPVVVIVDELGQACFPKVEPMITFWRPPKWVFRLDDIVREPMEYPTSG